ncbi:sigma-70 family RNA polymerase sigma factor [Kineosporia sp. J2-2]|uniref:Sigma-70 family RNA polymerase sigma factor n=1 Tax=Kineosporia corallincola TaxID=2835133 RepID=A0ABS5TE48_9ACTN|nr:sigma-70 family RNA polymerase sigma factor [Kineosporia corallincola]MBT0769347.1 sigma-70 family RNA polymerase sigma factor [Kineosporia corallincola]
MSEVRTARDTLAVEGHEAHELEQFRTELTAYAYRMLGSAFEAEDAVQEAMIRAWRGLDRFEGRSALRSWMYRITTNVCLDMLKGRERRALPMDLGPSQKTAEVVLGEPLGEATWIQPIPDGRVLEGTTDPAEAAVRRETVQLAFIALLQNLPPRQRVVLILREVLQWRASEVAELLDTSVASVNSALQRARATLATDGSTPEEAMARATAGARAGSLADGSAEGESAALLQRYLEVFENYDMEGLVALLHEDATMSMPPLDLWLSGPQEIVAWMTGPGHECRGSRLVPTSANGMPAFGQYRVAADGGWSPWSLQVLQVVHGQITEMTTFLSTPMLFPYFGLPDRLHE